MVPFVLCMLKWCEEQMLCPNLSSFFCWNSTHITWHLNILIYPRGCVRSMPENSHKSSVPLKSCHFSGLCQLRFSSLVASLPRSPSEIALPHSSCGAGHRMSQTQGTSNLWNHSSKETHWFRGRECLEGRGSTRSTELFLSECVNLKYIQITSF